MARGTFIPRVEQKGISWKTVWCGAAMVVFLLLLCPVAFHDSTKLGFLILGMALFLAFLSFNTARKLKEHEAFELAEKARKTAEFKTLQQQSPYGGQPQQRPLVNKDKTLLAARPELD